MEHTKNHLTIHLYRKDEALASIRWAILSRNHTEAIFWGLELYDSNMETDAIQMLAFTWVTCIGFGSLTCLESLQRLPTASREEWCQILMSWCKVVVHDTTAFHLLLRGASTPATWQPRFVHTKPYIDLDEALYINLRRGKLTEAWLIARAMNSETQWATIKQLAAEKKREGPFHIVYSCSQLSDVEKRAAAFTLVSLDGPYMNASLIPLSTNQVLPIELQEAIDTWDAEDSLRKRRVFKVRYEAILYLCQRSSQPVSESSEPEIQQDLEKSLVASSYWQQVLNTHIKPKKGEATDRNIEEFYDTFFNYKLHDIPDEWSLADREKSHGRGLGKSDEQAKKQFIDTTVQRSTTLGLWNSKVGSSYSMLANLNWPTLYDELHGSCFESLSLPITPQQKQFEIQLC